LEVGTPYLKNAAARSLRGRVGQEIALSLMEAFNDSEIPRETLIDSIGCREGSEIDSFFLDYIKTEMNEIKKLSEQKLSSALNPKELEDLLHKIYEHQDNIERALQSLKNELYDHYEEERAKLNGEEIHLW